MKVAYWPGCVSRGFTPELHGSMAQVAPLLDIELVELDRACCTGAGVIAEHSQELADSLNGRTFALAQQEIEGGADLIHRLFGRRTARLGLGACAQTTLAQLHLHVRAGAVQCLCIRVGADELHALHALGDHVIDGVAAAATHTDHLDLCAQVEVFNHFDCHVVPPVFQAVASE